MTEAERLRDMFKNMSKKNIVIQTFWATVVSVDWVNKTADVKDLRADLEVFEVLLGLGGDQVKPKIGSKCLCGIVENKDAAAFIIYCEEVDERWINGDSNGGLTKTPVLVQELAKLTARVDGIIDAINNGVPIAQDGGVGLQTTIKLALALLTDKESFSAIENTKVKHG